MTFFFDRCVPVGLCNIIKAAEGKRRTIAYHDDHFPRDTPDPDWIRAIGKWPEKPAVISGDNRILSRPDEARALKEENLVFFCLDGGWSQCGFWEVAWRFLKLWPGIVDEAKKCRQPEIFKVGFGKSMKIEPVVLTQNLRVK